MKPTRCAFLFLVAILLAPPQVRADEAKAESYRVPYQLTQTSHILVRVKINGKGPFNFIIDTGAPALHVGTHVAKKLELEPDKKGWGTFDKFEIEGGITLDKVQGRIEDPFQLIGMNQMNLPGVRLDGMIGYTLLAKYRIEYDFTRPHLVWTKLDWDPPPPKGLADLGGAPAEVAIMGTMVKIMAMFVPRRPDPIIIQRGFLGVELADEAGGVRIKSVLASSPAAEAGIKPGDQLGRFQDKAVKDIAEIQKLAADQPAGNEIRLEVMRDGKKLEVTLKANKGL